MLDLIHNYGDFRSIRSEVDSIAELTSANMVRNAIMINFLRQQQLKKLWSNMNLEEGIVLKRSKSDFICQPEELSSLRGRFYDQVKRLNVKVCFFCSSSSPLADSPGIHDGEYFRHPDLP